MSFFHFRCHYPSTFSPTKRFSFNQTQQHQHHPLNKVESFLSSFEVLSRKAATMANWELKNCCDKDQKIFIACVAAFTVVIFVVRTLSFSLPQTPLFYFLLGKEKTHPTLGIWVIVSSLSFKLKKFVKVRGFCLDY